MRDNNWVGDYVEIARETYDSRGAVMTVEWKNNFLIGRYSFFRDIYNNARENDNILNTFVFIENVYV